MTRDTVADMSTEANGPLIVAPWSPAPCVIHLTSVAITFRDWCGGKAVQYDSESSINIPAHAVWIADRGVFSWTEPHSAVDRRCSDCFLGDPCVRRIEVSPVVGSLVSAHVAPEGAAQ